MLLAAQGAIGAVQYWLELPAEIVWVHASLAAATWVAIVWTLVAAGGLRATRGQRAASRELALPA